MRKYDVDHYRYTHSITSAYKINYTLDYSTIEVRRQIQRSLTERNSVNLRSEDVIWIPSNETMSNNNSLDSKTMRNFVSNSSYECPAIQEMIESESLPHAGPTLVILMILMRVLALSQKQANILQ
uniref:Uncharacterized protein n=1 Tax=Ditylenchus dipsaci TaxID=166011 RepID=A0A915DLR2_9BILA